MSTGSHGPLRALTNPKVTDRTGISPSRNESTGRNILTLNWVQGHSGITRNEKKLISVLYKKHKLHTLPMNQLSEYQNHWNWKRVPENKHRKPFIDVHSKPEQNTSCANVKLSITGGEHNLFCIK